MKRKEFIMAKLDPKDLLKTGAHFGHKTSRWHPKMAPYIYDKRDGVHIIDLFQTVELLEEACDKAQAVAARGGDILFVGTKKQVKDLVKTTAEKIEQPYVTERWMGGMLTNKATMKSRIKHLKKLEKEMDSGEMEAMYNKLELQRFEEEIEKLNESFGGIKNMDGEPDLLIVVDTVDDDLAVAEANRINVPVVGIVDTNADPRLVDLPVPANDDSIKTVEMILQQLVAAIETGTAKGAAATAKANEADAKAAEKKETK